MCNTFILYFNFSPILFTFEINLIFIIIMIIMNYGIKFTFYLSVFLTYVPLNNILISKRNKK